MGPQPLWRRSVHDEIGWFDETLASAGDYEFWCRLACRHPLRHIPQFLGLYYENPEGICNADTSRGARETAHVKNLYQKNFPAPTRSFTTNYQWLEPVTPQGFVNITMVTYNRLEFTRQAIEGVVRFTRFPHVLTVIDNASTDGTPDYLRGMQERGIIKNLVLLEENVGVAKAANLGWSLEPEAAYYLKLDNDIVIRKPDWLEEMVRVIDDVPSLGAVAYNFEPKSYPLRFVDGHGIRIKDFGNLGGACILIPRRTFDLLGYWCEDYGLYSEEDADYGFRIRAAGLQIAYLADEEIGDHLPAGRAAVIDTETLAAADGIEEHQHGDYRRWKDAQRRRNIGPDGPFTRNIAAYRSGTKPLRAPSAFVTAGAARTHTQIPEGASDMALRINQPATVAAQPQPVPQAGTPLISVLVSSYNAEQFMRECLTDLMQQTIADRLEIIVIDAASPQAEGAVVADFQRRHGNIIYVRTGTRIGVYAAWNLAIRMAQGTYLMPFSTNDRLRRDACEILARELERNPGVALTYGDSFITKIPHETFEQHTRAGEFRWPDYSYEQLLQNCMVGPHPMWRRSVHEEIGLFDESFVALGDQDFFIRVGARWPLKHIPEFTGLYWMSDDGLSNRKEIFEPELARLRAKHPVTGRPAPAPAAQPAVATPTPSLGPDHERAATLKAAGKCIEALEVYSNILTSGDSSVLADIGDCLTNLQKYDDALSVYHDALKRTPHDGRALVGIGVVKLMTGRQGDAAEAFTKALRCKPQDSKALCGLGLARCGQGRPQEAFDAFRQAVEADPENLTALHELVKLAYELNRFAETAGALESYLRYHPADTDILFSQAGILFMAGQDEAARDAVERLLAVAPGYEGAPELLGKLTRQQAGERVAMPMGTGSSERAQQLKEAGNYDEALAEYARLREAGNRSVLADMGECSAYRGQYGEAVGFYQEALKEDETNVKALVGLGVVSIVEEKLVKAVTWFNKALKVDPANARALCGLGMVRNLQGKHEEAFELFARATDANPEDLNALHELVKLTYATGRFAEAEERLASYLRHHPADLDMLYSLAGIQFKAGRLPEALENVEKVLLFAPEYEGGSALFERIRETM